jgi:hypothetical protein
MTETSLKRAPSVARAIAFLILATVAVPAFAQAPLVFDYSWGSWGSAPGQMKEPFSIACASDGSVYVQDLGNLRVEHFTRAGALLEAWPLASQVPGPALGMAVGPDGSVYVARPETEDIEVYAPHGALLRTIVPGGGAVCRGVFVKPDGTTYALTDHGIFVYDGLGQFLWRTAAGGSVGGAYFLSLDELNQIYVSTSPNVTQLSPSGDILNVWFATPPGDSLLDFPAGLTAHAGTVIVVDDAHPRLLGFTATGDPTWIAAIPVGDRPYGGVDIVPDGDSGYFVLDSTGARVIHMAPQAVPARPTSWGVVKDLYRR